MKNTGSTRAVSPILWITGVAAILAIAFFIFQRSLAARDRKQFEIELAATGVLDWRALIPTMPPDDENFFAAQIVRRWLPIKGTVPAKDADPAYGPPVLPAGWFMGGPPAIAELSNLPALGTGNTLESLGQWLDRWDSSFVEFREAGKRPYAVLPGNYSSPELVPILNFVSLRSLAHTVATRARVHLLQHRGDLALLDLDTLELLMRALEAKPATLVAAMIRVAIAELYIEVVKDGFALSLWKTENLDPLRLRLEGIQLVPAYLSSLREGEMAAASYLLQEMAEGKIAHRRRLLQLFGSNNRWTDEALAFLPSGSVRRNQLLVAQLIKSWMDAFESDGTRYYPKRAQEGNTRVNAEFSKLRLGNVLAGSFIPNIAKACSVCARTQTRLSQAAIACALESYRADHGVYPERLSDMKAHSAQSGSAMATDLITGSPFRYRRAGSTNFILYSVGEDEVDDGGTAPDWVW